MNFLVAQLGARMHYAIPRMLYQAGVLKHFYTDICAVKGWPRLLGVIPGTLQSAGMKRLLGRIPKEVPAKNITAFTSFGFEYQRRRASSSKPTDVTRTHLWAGKRFCQLVLADGLHGVDGVYTFNSAGLELLSEARRQGLYTVMEQTIAPREIETELLLEEHERFSDWEPPPTEDKAKTEFIARERAEWEMADLILCGSDFVRESIAACGGPTEKCSVVPYGVDGRFSITERYAHDGPLRVLTVGGIGLRKGSPYVLEASKALRKQATFRMVGSVQSSAQHLLSASLEVTGVVPRSEIEEHFAWADVFLLPSLCEGSATVVYEALAAGLPVVCTPNAGSVVRDGIDGYVIPIREAQAITEALMTFVRNPNLLCIMGANARVRAGDYTLDRYQQRLLAAMTSATNKMP